MLPCILLLILLADAKCAAMLRCTPHSLGQCCLILV